MGKKLSVIAFRLVLQLLKNHIQMIAREEDI